ncbi:MAG TPA: type II secretion system protein GspG [Cytophagaceae bacterium]
MWYLLASIIYISGIIVIWKSFSGRDRKFFLSGWIATPIIIFGLVVVLLGKGSNSLMPFKADRTEREMKAISEELERYKDFNKQYPENLNAIIGNDPTKNGWRNDYWQNPYFYKPAPDKQAYTLISPGSDGILNSKDDIKIEK